MSNIDIVRVLLYLWKNKIISEDVYFQIMVSVLDDDLRNSNQMKKEHQKMTDKEIAVSKDNLLVLFNEIIYQFTKDLESIKK